MNKKYLFISFLIIFTVQFLLACDLPKGQLSVNLFLNDEQKEGANYTLYLYKSSQDSSTEIPASKVLLHNKGKIMLNCLSEDKYIVKVTQTYDSNDRDYKLTTEAFDITDESRLGIDIYQSFEEPLTYNITNYDHVEECYKLTNMDDIKKCLSNN